MTGSPRRIMLSLSTSLLLMLAAFPLLSIGSTNDQDWLMWLGLLLVTLGGLIPLLRRFISREPPGERDNIGMHEDARVS